VSSRPIPEKSAVSDAQAAVYETRAAEYDALIAAEDVDGALPRALDGLVRVDGAIIADVGAGTGRFARLLARRAAHVHLIDRAAPMLDVARERLASDGATNVTLHVSDARSLPLPDGAVDLAVAGWVFGHFPHWMPDDWKTEVAAALAEMRRVVKPGGSIVIVETLGTGHETPRKHEKLDPYFAWLMESEGFAQTILRTDYGFPDVESAARICGAFFGDALVSTIRERGWARVPECTSVFVARTAR
jgi:ubiquinone/menaquinone biosynthesis C-methylase UbiE